MAKFLKITAIFVLNKSAVECFLCVLVEQHKGQNGAHAEIVVFNWASGTQLVGRQK